MSSDDSFQLLKSLTLTDSRFRIFINSNISTINSPASARNCAISHAKGRYCCFLDIDDCWSSSHLQNYFDVLTSQPHISLVYADYYRFSVQSNKLVIRETLPASFLPLFSHFSNPIPMLTSCVRRSYLHNIKFETVHHEDFLFWQSILSEIPYQNIFKSTDLTSAYRLSSQSLSGSFKPKTLLWIYRCHRFKSISFLTAITLTSLWIVYQSYLFLREFLPFPLSKSDSFSTSFTYSLSDE